MRNAKFKENSRPFHVVFIEPNQASYVAHVSVFRLVLGMAQIAGVGMALGVISKQGISAAAILLVIATTLLTVISVAAFGRRPRS